MDNKKKRIKFSLFRVISDSAVINIGLSITPIVVASTAGYDALVISGVMCYLLFINTIAGLVLRDLVPKQFNYIVYTFIAAFAYIPVGMLLEREIPLIVDNIGIYLPLLVVSSMVVVQAPGTHKEKSILYKLERFFSLSISFTVLSVMVGMLREYMSVGTVFTVSLPVLHRFASAVYPYVGFVILAFVCAAMKYLENRSWKSRINGWRDE